MTLVSWLIPTHKYSKLLIKSIDSCIQQSYLCEYEILVIVNGPTRHFIASELHKLYSPTHPQLRVLVSSLVGLVPALNQGIQEAKGKYIARLDGDDYSCESRLEVQLKIMKGGNYNLVHSQYYLHEKGQPQECRQPWIWRYLEDEVALYFLNPICHPSVLLLRSDILSVGGYPSYRYSEDYGLWLRLKCAGLLRSKRIHHPLIYYNIESCSGSRRNPKAYMGQAQAALDAFAQTLSVLWLATFIISCFRYFTMLFANKVSGSK